MALEITACFTQTSIVETTGIYNGTSGSPQYNPTGWENASTDFIANATAASVAIYVPDPTTLKPVVSPITVDLFPTLPNYLFLGADLDYFTVDGVYYFTYSVTTNNASPYTFSQYKLFTPQVDCCIQTLSDIAICDEGKMKVFSEAYDLWQTMKYSGCCGKLNQAVVQLKKLKRICAKNGCCNC